MSHTLPVTGNTEETKPENRAFYPALDGLRAVAFVMVFLHHYAQVPFGWAGVNVFFVLSGFLITGILYDVRDDPHRARNFYVRRTLRIFPLYYGICLVVVLLEPFLHWQWTRAWFAWPLYVGNYLPYLSKSAGIDGSPLQLASIGHLTASRFGGVSLSFGHFWSLCVEEQFYLFWPWTVFWLRSRRALLWICGIAVVLTPVLRAVCAPRFPAWMQVAQPIYHTTPFQLDSLLLGGLVALLWRGARREALLRVARISVFAMSMAAVVWLAWIAHHTPDWFNSFPYPSWTLTWGAVSSTSSPLP